MGQDLVKSIRQSIGHGKKAFEKLASEQSNGMVWAKESGFAMQVIDGNDYLQKCPVDSFRRAIVNVAAIGLSLNPAEKLAYLVPRDGKACLDISYRGLVKICTDSGSILWAKAMIVHEDDTFQFVSVDEKPLHTFNAFKERGKIVGGYSIAKLHNGDYLVDAMSMKDIDAVKNTSKAKNGPWKTWPEEMMKKTLLRRGSKSWPISQRLMAAEAVLNEHQGIEIVQQPEKEITPKVDKIQICMLNKLAVDSHVNVQKIFEAFNIESIEELPETEFAACKSRLEKALEAHNKKTEKKNADS